VVSGTSTIIASQAEAGGAVREATAIVQVVASDQTGPTPTPGSGGTNGGVTATSDPLPWIIAVAVVLAALGVVLRAAVRRRGTG
jgi:hypothetical protein